MQCLSQSDCLMYICINCGVETEELYRRYCPSVLKVLKCEKCGQLADKYIEYDPVIVLVDLILIEKQAYRHLLYNSNFKSYWKLMTVLWLGESFRIWSYHGLKQTDSASAERDIIDVIQGNNNFYLFLLCTAVSMSTFIFTVVLITELRWLLISKKPYKYSSVDLCRALTVGGCAKLLGLLGIVWEHISSSPHYLLIQGYTILCLLTAYSVVCRTGKGESLIGLAGGFLAYTYVSNIVSTLPLTISHITLMSDIHLFITDNF